MTLHWEKVDSTVDYSYELEYNDETKPIPLYLEEYLVEGLSPGTEYFFTLYTVLDTVRSSGYNFSNITVPSNVENVSVNNRNETEMTLQWEKVNNNTDYNYELEFGDTKVTTDSLEKHTVKGLSPGTEYLFTLYTVFKDLQSSGHNFIKVTAINCESFNWKVTNSSIEASVNGSTLVTAENSTGISKRYHVGIVNLQDLYPGAIYNVSLWYDLDSETVLPQCSHFLTLYPNSVPNLHCKYFSGGYGLAVIWDHPYGVVDVVQVDIGSKSLNRSSNESPRQEVTGLQAAQWYKVTVTSFSGAKQSKTESLNCQTDPAGVIAGVLVFFLLVIIICAAVYWWLRYGSAKQMKSPKLVEPKVTNKSYKYV
ncbi:Receptor-type tyrosine-protein phosphatase H [Anabarilius grahami]|uniref:Receptor-type tyrosine-protein phosphatase H n=1 Tax=Anabarilius grahami TaxID=495550 RepID=A0A3N0YKJ4_ANAGA|nr:Receptor-type tyrosine-protein phosphatase H [Anabarilius grahami]